MLAGGTLAGCSSSTDSSYKSIQVICAKASRSVGNLPAPGKPVEAMQWAIDRYVLVEGVLSTVSTGQEPNGAAGRDLRSKWLDPASHGLDVGRPALTDLRDAVHADRNDDVGGLFATAAAVGTSGVDIAYLAAHGMPACGDLFGATPAPTYPA